MKSDDEIIESLIAGGIIGAALGVLLLKNKEEGMTLGALAGAAILATFKANEQAKKTNVSLYFEEDGKLYEQRSGGLKKFIKTIEKPKVKLPDTFILK